MGRRKQRRKLTRREFLRRSAAVAAAPALAGCGGSGGSSSLAGGSTGSNSGGGTGGGGGGSSSIFQHGIASGDPLTNAIVIWTRITSSDPGPIDVFWEMALDTAFNTIARSGTFTTAANRDFTAKIDVNGLASGTTYYYRFTALGQTSPIGRCRTAPEGVVDRLRFALVSCASYPHGFFNAYRRIAERQDLQAVLHLGDYIYEYGNGPGEYGADVQAGGRRHDPEHEMVSLADYRTRYNQYKQDADLQALHQQHPIIHIWDDHEFTDNTWRDGANNHQPATEGDWTTRSEAATRAYNEWMPTRELAPVGGRARIFRQFRFGDLTELVMLDTRYFDRDEQNHPDLMVGPVPAFQDAGVHAADRSMIGPDQLDFLRTSLQGSTAQWKIVGQQVIFAQLKGIGQPNALSPTPGGQGGFFLNIDQWDGYPRARERVWEVIRGGDASAAPAVAIPNVVIVTGDVHTSWAFDITEDPNNVLHYNPNTGSGSMAVEFVCTSVTSPGEFPSGTETIIQGNNPHLKYRDFTRKGYMILDIDTNRCQGEHWYVGDHLTPDDTESFAAAHFTSHNENRLQQAVTPSDELPNPPAFAPT